MGVKGQKSTLIYEVMLWELDRVSVPTFIPYMDLYATGNDVPPEDERITL